MADETIILDIELNATKSLSQLTQLSNGLRQLIEEKGKLDAKVKDGTATESEVARLKQLETQIKVNKTEIKSLSAQLDAARKGGDDYGDSLNEMRRKLSDLQKTYDGLSKAERENADVGGKLQEAIKDQHDAVLELEGATGRMQRNVGNYQQAFENAIPGLGKFSGTLKTMGVGMDDLASKGTKAFSGLGKSVKAFGKTFLTPPVIVISVVVGAIVTVLGKLKEAFNKSDDAGTALASGLAALKPIGTAIGKMFDGLANIIGNLAEGFGNFVSSVMKGGAALGLWSDEAGNAVENAQKLVHAQDDLEEAERQYTVNSAERNKQISELRNKAKESLDPKESKKYLEQANELAKKNLEDEKKIAAEKLRILEQTAKQENDTSDATKNAIAEARAAMYNAEKAYFDGVRELQEQSRSADLKIQEEEKRKAEEAKKKREEYLAKKREQAKTELEIARQLEDALLQTIEDADARDIARAKIDGEREIAALQERLNTEKDLTKKAKADLSALILEKQRQLDDELKRMADDVADRRAAEYMEQATAVVDAENARHQALIEARLANNEGDVELQKQLLQLQFDAMLEQLDEQLQVELENKTLSEEQKTIIEDEYRALRLEKEQQFINQMTNIDKAYSTQQALTIQQAKDKMSQSFLSMAKDAAGAFGQLSTLLAEYGAENEDAAKASKAFALTQIITDQAVSIASNAKAFALAVEGATAAAAATGPAAPFTLAAYIAEMVGLVLASIAGLASSFVSAKQTLSSADNTGSYETGGIIGGTSYSGDRLTANVNSGEMILNRNQQARLFDIANGQGGRLFDYSLMTDAMVAAVAAQPAPVMAYSEFKDFQSRTATYDEFARI